VNKDLPEIRKHQIDAEILEKAIMGEDLSGLTPQERLKLYAYVCQSLGLNPYTKPFCYLKLRRKVNGKIVEKLILYAKKDCAEQLRKIHGISLKVTNRQKIDDFYMVSVYAEDRIGRFDEATASVCIKGLQGQDLCDAIMKCETKAKRRVTFSICGLTWMDKLMDQVESIKDKQTEESEPEPEPELDSSFAEVVDPEELKKEYEDKERFYNEMHAWAQKRSYDWPEVKEIIEKLLRQVKEQHETIPWNKMIQPAWIERMKERVEQEYLSRQLPPLPPPYEQQGLEFDFEGEEE